MIQSKLYRFVLAFGAVVLVAACTQQAEKPSDQEPEAETLAAMQALLDTQVEAWNAGDINAFMEGYWKSDSLRFASGGNVRRGWDETLARYLATYPDKAAMGTLTFEDLELQKLSEQWATGFGRFRLKRTPPLEDLTGLFTLMFEKRDGSWIIVSDHTSAAS
ncbi:MAG: nuclear transport factor 2 family protein [Bacteroidota bacterium]